MLNSKVRNNENGTITGFADKAPDGRLTAKGIELCRPFRAVISSSSAPGVSQRATPGYSNCIPPGCAATEMSEIRESRSGFVLQDIDGEELMRPRCPETEGESLNAKARKKPRNYRKESQGVICKRLK
jgi:hypothetical protein